MLFIADLHLDNWKQFSTLLGNGFNSRLMEQIKVVNKVAKIIEETGEQEVIFLGDLTNSFSDAFPQIVYDAAFYTCQTWSAKAHLRVLIGNHDIYRGMHRFSAMESLPNCEIITTPTRATIQGYKVDLIPWGWGAPKVKGDILAGHMPILGSWVSGDKAKQADEGYFKEDLFGYQYVFLGHFHERQVIDVQGVNYAGYIGSLMQLNLGSAPTDRGVTLYRNNTVRTIDIPSPRIYEVTIPTQEAADYFLDETHNPTDYFKIILTNYNLTLPPFDHRVLVEYDIAPTQESRLAENPDEDIRETIDRFIEQANTKLDKKEIKAYLNGLEKRV